MQVAALYVDPDGAYYGLPGVDPWDEARNATQPAFRAVLLGIARSVAH